MSASTKPIDGVEAELERMVQLVAYVCEVPVVYAVVLDETMQVCKAAHGLSAATLTRPHPGDPGKCCDAGETVFCRPWDYDVQPEQHVTHQLCAPLRTPGGQCFGALCLANDDADALDANRGRLIEFAAHLSWLMRTWSQHPTAEKTRTLIENVSTLMNDVVWECDAENRFTQVTTLNGESRDHLIGLKPDEVFAGSTDATDWAAHRARVEARLPYENHEFTIEVDGQTVHVASSGYPVFDNAGEFKGYRGIARDVTALKATGDENAPLGFDPVTNLMNRHGWTQCLQHMLPGNQAFTPCSAVLVIDVDDFSRLNEQYGHDVGDEALRIVARAIESEIRVQDRLARIGGDEFSIIAGDIETPQDAADLAERIQEAFLLPFEIEGPDGAIEVEISVTIGIALAPQDGETADQIISSAGLALAAARTERLGSFDFYADTLRSDLRGQVQLEEDIKNAVAGHEFELFYQPQLSLKDNRIVGAEALLRWRHPTRGLVPPGLFIDALEAGPYAGPVGNWVLQECCRQAKEWRDLGFNLRLGLNMSVSHFQPDNDVVALLDETLKALDLPPTSIEMEVTENVVFQSGETGQQVIKGLRNLGVHVAFDDFGTGYGSLSDLRRIAVDRIKVDRSFIMDALSNPHDRALLNGIVSLVKSLDLEIIAEGVEEIEQETHLRSIGCDEVQGYLYAKPMPGSAFLELLQDEAQDREEDHALRKLIERHERQTIALRAAG